MEDKNIIYLIGILQLIVIDPIMWYFMLKNPIKNESAWAITLVINLFMFAAIIFIIMRQTIKERV